MKALYWLFVGGILWLFAYVFVDAEGPAPPLHWEPYATNKESGKLVWVWAGPYATRDECMFNARKDPQNSASREPLGCLYFGYQNRYVQWIVNSLVAPGDWRCIARMTKREKFDDPVFQPILRDGNSEGDGWKCDL
ncbi:hypothetical protein [Bradyrhizobium sp. C9]|uniref:hypothetical protein n=1 Tax=Bradyrhizobium sp. C9 TaxID=142585 RepID=UPI001177D1BD|nr:hypothetical protein [Bradyrhizobium sp. C9]